MKQREDPYEESKEPRVGIQHGEVEADRYLKLASHPGNLVKSVW